MEELLKHVDDDVRELLQAHVLVVRGAGAAVEHRVDVVGIERRARLVLDPVPQIGGHDAAGRAGVIFGARERRGR